MTPRDDAVATSSHEEPEWSCTEPEAPGPGEPGWWGGNWVEALDGSPTTSLEVEPLPDGLEWSVRFVVMGSGGEHEWVEGPFSGATSEVELDPLEIAGLGDDGVVVSAVFEVSDSETGQVIRHQKADEVILRDPGTATQSLARLDDEVALARAADTIESGPDGEDYEDEGSYTFEEVTP